MTLTKCCGVPRSRRARGQRASDGARRDLLTAFFDRLVVYVTDEGIKIEAECHDANLRIREIHGHIALARQHEQSAQNETPRSQAGSSVHTQTRSVHLTRV
ncbi:hypothetical protein LG315_06790 [Microbacterium marinum]|uniref:hypothetical protein n=1 Tax=Microbacterium marinum TaxID=421115 RepID=UPI0038516D6E